MKLRPSVDPFLYNSVLVIVMHVASPCKTSPPVGVPALSRSFPYVEEVEKKLLPGIRLSFAISLLTSIDLGVRTVLHCKVSSGSHLDHS